MLGPHTHTPAPAACGWQTPTARPVGRQSGEGERLTSDAPRNGGRHPPRGRPSATPTASNAGPQGRTDRTLDTRVAGPRPHAPEDGRSGEGQRLTPDAPHNSGRPHPPGTAPHHPRGTQPLRGVQAKPGREEPGPDRPPPEHARQSKGPGQDTRRGTDHVERPYQRPVPGPREVRTPHHPGGGGSGRRGSASAHTRKRHAGTTRRATGPSSRNAQTAWNGVPASEGKGHPDGTARHTQRGTRGAGRGKRERHNTRYRPEPSEPAASAAHTRTGHCTRQGSSGALRHAPTPRQGSLRASPRGSYWQQASSTGPAAPAPRATTH